MNPLKKTNKRLLPEKKKNTKKKNRNKNTFSKYHSLTLKRERPLISELWSRCAPFVGKPLRMLESLNE